MGRLRYKGEDERFKYNRKKFEDFVNDLQFDYRDSEPVVCKQFGCGKKLNLWESLYGDKCYYHRTNKLPLALEEDEKLTMHTSRKMNSFF